MTADDELSAHGIVAHGRELEARQPTVAGYAYRLHRGLFLPIEGIGGVYLGINGQPRGGGVRLAARGLGGHKPCPGQLNSVVGGLGHFYFKALAEWHLNQS